MCEGSRGCELQVTNRPVQQTSVFNLLQLSLSLIFNTWPLPYQPSQPTSSSSALQHSATTCQETCVQPLGFPLILVVIFWVSVLPYCFSSWYQQQSLFHGQVKPTTKGCHSQTPRVHGLKPTEPGFGQLAECTRKILIFERETSSDLVKKSWLKRGASFLINRSV